MIRLIILIGLFIVIGCSPITRLNRIYTNHPELQPRDTVITLIVTRDSIAYRDTTLFIRLPGDTVTISGEVIYLPTSPIEVKIRPDTLSAETEFSQASAWIQEMRLNLQLIDKDTTLLIRLDSLTKEVYYWKEEYEKVVTTVKEKHLPKFYEIMTWVGVGMIGLLLLGIIFRVLK